MTESDYNCLVDLRNKCYQDRRDRETETNYFTGFNDGYEKGKESLAEENAVLEKRCTNYKAEMEKNLADAVKLEKEKAELIEQNRSLLESCEGATMMYKDLQKAKELIKTLLLIADNKVNQMEFQLCVADAKQFLNSKVEK